MKYAEQLRLFLHCHDFTVMDYTNPEDLLSPRLAMRMMCLGCCSGDRKAVAKCPFTSCPIYPYRTGRDAHRQLAEERARLDALIARLDALIEPGAPAGTTPPLKLRPPSDTPAAPCTYRRALEG